MNFAAGEDPAPMDEVEQVLRLLRQAQHQSVAAGNTLLHLSVMLANVAVEDLDPEFEREAVLEIFGLIRRKKMRPVVSSAGRPFRFGEMTVATL